MNHIDLPELQRDILDLIARSPHWSPKQAELAADFGALLDVIAALAPFRARARR